MISFLTDLTPSVSQANFVIFSFSSGLSTLPVKKILPSRTFELIDKKFIPNITFYLKLDKKNLMKRKNKRVYSNKFDKKYFGQFSRIQKNYNEISKMKIRKRKFVTIDASLSANEIHEKIIVHLKKCK